MADRFIWHTGLSGEFLYSDLDTYPDMVTAKAFRTDGDGMMEGRVLFMNTASVPSPYLNGSWIYAADVVAGNAAMHFKSELGHIIKLFSAVAVADAVTAHTVASWSDSEDALDALGVKVNAILALLRANGLLLP
jgi:hypothetical protein